MQYTAILFDCDGVLIDSERIFIAVEREMLAQIGLEYDLRDYRTRFMGLKSADYLSQVEADHGVLGIGPFPPDFARNLGAACRERLERELVAIAGIDALLDRLEIPIAVASSSALEALHRKLVLTGLHHRFDPHIYSGEQVERGKPAPDLFLYVAKQLGETPQSCLVIEDSVNGVKAGLAAGMTVWGFTGGGHADDDLQQRLAHAGAHDVFNRFTDMTRHLVS